jgi:hypothetical protein
MSLREFSLIICSFLNIEELYNFEMLNIFFYTFLKSQKVWNFISKQQNFPVEIFSKKEYEIFSNPLIVKEQELYYSIIENNWAKKWYEIKKINKNGVEDHIYKSYIKSIMKLMIQVKNNRFLYNCLKDKKCTDWKISLNIQIEDLLKKSELYKNDLEKYDELNKYFL